MEKNIQLAELKKFCSQVSPAKKDVSNYLNPNTLLDLKHISSDFCCMLMNKLACLASNKKYKSQFSTSVIDNMLVHSIAEPEDPLFYSQLCMLRAVVTAEKDIQTALNYCVMGLERISDKGPKTQESMYNMFSKVLSHISPKDFSNLPPNAFITTCRTLQTILNKHTYSFFSQNSYNNIHSLLQSFDKQASSSTKNRNITHASIVAAAELADSYVIKAKESGVENVFLKKYMDIAAHLYYRCGNFIKAKDFAIFLHNSLAPNRWRNAQFTACTLTDNHSARQPKWEYYVSAKVKDSNFIHRAFQRLSATEHLQPLLDIVHQAQQGIYAPNTAYKYTHKPLKIVFLSNAEFYRVSPIKSNPFSYTKGCFTSNDNTVYINYNTFKKSTSLADTLAHELHHAVLSYQYGNNALPYYDSYFAKTSTHARKIKKGAEHIGKISPQVLKNLTPAQQEFVNVMNIKCYNHRHSRRSEIPVRLSQLITQYIGEIDPFSSQNSPTVFKTADQILDRASTFFPYSVGFYRAEHKNLKNYANAAKQSPSVCSVSEVDVIKSALETEYELKDKASSIQPKIEKAKKEAERLKKAKEEAERLKKTTHKKITEGGKPKKPSASNNLTSYNISDLRFSDNGKEIFICFSSNVSTVSEPVIYHVMLRKPINPRNINLETLDVASVQVIIPLKSHVSISYFDEHGNEQQIPQSEKMKPSTYKTTLSSRTPMTVVPHKDAKSYMPTSSMSVC